MFWRSSKGLFAVVPVTAVLSYLLLTYVSREDEGPVVRMESQGKQLSSREGAVEERELASIFKNLAKGPRVPHEREAWGIKGWVRDSEGRPFSGVRVEVGADKAGLYRRIGEARSDAAGHWSLSLDSIKDFSAAFRDGSQLLVRFRATDYPHLDRSLDMPAWSARRYTPQLVVQMGDGCKITGRILDRHRRSIAGAWIFVSGPETSQAYFDRVPTTQTNAFGRFEFFIRARGKHVIEAFKPGVGGSPRVQIEVRRQKTIQIRDQFMASGRTITGILHYRDGSPVATATLLAQITPLPVGRPTRQHADRLEELEFRTDKSGRFRLGGLENGIFAIGDRKGSLLGFATPLDTTQDHARIEIHRQRLEVRIRDRDGYALPGTKLHVSVWTGKNARIARDQYRKTGDLDVMLEQASRRGFVHLRRKTGDLDLWLERGSYCWIRLAIPGCLPVARGILLDPDQNEQELDIILQNR